MAKLKVGLLGLTLEFYEKGIPQLRPGREEFVRRRVLPKLEAVAEVRFAGACFTRQMVERAVAGFEAEGVDAILVVLLSYSPSLISAPALLRTRLPIVVWNTQELLAVDQSYGIPELLANHGVHGTFDLCNVLVRAGRRFGYVTGHVDDAGATGELDDFFAAARGVKKLSNARLGLLGYPFPGMGDFGLDTTQMASTLGCEWVMLGLPEYVSRCEEAEGKAVNEWVGVYRDAYDLAPDVTAEDLAAAARAEVAMRGLIRDYRLDGFTYQFLAFGEDRRVETIPFVATSRLLAEGIGFGGEGDLIAAAGSALLSWIQSPASFSEIFTIDFAGNSVLMSHMGEANVAMSRRDRKVRLMRRPSLVPIRGSQLVLAGSFEPGEATLMALTVGEGQRWRIISSLMQIVDFGPLEQLFVPHSKMKPQGDVREFLTAYAKAGGPHHLAVCFGDARQRLRTAAEMIAADYVEV